MPTIKKLYFASGVAATAPTDLSLASSTVKIEPYANDAAFVSANGTAQSGDCYINTTLQTVRIYTGSAWRSLSVLSDPSDATKLWAVDLAGATTGTTATFDFNQTASRVYTFPDAAGNIALVPSSGVVRSNGTVLSSGSVDLASETTGVLGFSGGGSGQTTANAALNAFLPSQSGNAGKYLKTDGTNTSWDAAGGGGGSESILIRTNIDYTVLDGDGYTTILFSTGASNRTLTLPTLADNANRVIRVKKIDSGVGTVIIDGESAETIDGATTITISQQYEEVEIQAYTSEWVTLKNGIVTGTTMGYLPSSNAHLDNASATRLGLKQYSHGTTYNGGNAPTVTLVSGGGTLSSVDLSLFIPYQMQDGTWRMKFNVVVSLSLATRTSTELAIAGVTFKNVPTSAVGQSISGDCGTTATLGLSRAKNNSGNIDTAFSSVTSGSARFSGDVQLESKPTWAF